VTEEQIQIFNSRIDELTLAHDPAFGKMNVNQMICHCADFFRMAIGEKKANEYGKVNPDKIRAIANSGKSAPAPKGFGQVEGDGTKSTNIENDKLILKEYVLKFSTLPKNFNFAPHPYFGNLDHERWIKLAVYHLDHHLKQFTV